MKWKLLSSELVFEKYLKVEKRVYELPNGIKDDFYIRIVGDTVAVLALTPDHKVITAKQYRPGPGMLCNELPGGRVDKDETPLEAVARELWEETGYTGTFHLVTDYYFDAYTTGRRHAFVATNCRKVDRQHLDSGEDIAVELVSLSEFLTLARSGQITDVDAALLGLGHLHLL